MTFLVPAVLAGLGAVAAPVIIHLLNRRRVRVVRWGATRFLLQATQKNQRRVQVEQWLLLSMRCLAVVLLALAFARPVVNPAGAGADPAAVGPRMAVILLDQSASMGQSDGLQTRFEQAKAAARRLLDGFEPGSQAALFLVANRVNPVVGRPTADLPLVRRALELADQTARTDDLAAAVRQALDTLRPITGAGKEIDLISDNQAGAWQDIEEVRKALADAPEVRFKVIPVGERGEDNLAITALRPETAAPAAGQGFGCLVEIANFSSAPATNLRVTLAVDDGPPVDEATVERIEPGATRTARLRVRLPKAGYYVLNAALPADRLPADDRRAVAVHVVEPRTLALVEGGPAANPQDRDAFFLANALVPVAAARRADYHLKTEAFQPAWLQTADLARYPVVFLCDVPSLETMASQKLARYVQDGGSLVIFPGPRTQPDSYNDDPALHDLLPARLGPNLDPGRNGGAAAWQGKDYHHPVTALWNDPANGNLGTVRATQYYPLALPAAGTSQVVVAYADGAPAVVERASGKGRVVLFGVPATTRWSNLPIHPDWVPLLRRLVDYLASDNAAASLSIPPGAVFQQKVGGELAGRELSVVRPGGVTRPAGKVELVGQEAVVRYRDTESAGGYRLKVAGEENTVAAFAVGIDPKESDLRVMDRAKIDALMTDRPGQPSAPTNAPEVQASAGVRRELWLPLLCAAGLALLGEMFLAHKLSVPR